MGKIRLGVADRFGDPEVIVGLDPGDVWAHAPELYNDGPPVDAERLRFALSNGLCTEWGLSSIWFSLLDEVQRDPSAYWARALYPDGAEANSRFMNPSMHGSPLNGKVEVRTGFSLAYPWVDTVFDASGRPVWRNMHLYGREWITFWGGGEHRGAGSIELIDHPVLKRFLREHRQAIQAMGIDLSSLD